MPEDVSCRGSLPVCVAPGLPCVLSKSVSSAPEPSESVIGWMLISEAMVMQLKLRNVLHICGDRRSCAGMLGR